MVRQDKGNCITPAKIIPMITDREREVLDLLKEGYTVKEIANELYLSHHTVQSHKQNLIKKFEARNTVQMVVRAVRNVSVKK
jgi:DNA-binding NarL/FixJ family response regulator